MAYGEPRFTNAPHFLADTKLLYCREGGRAGSPQGFSHCSRTRQFMPRERILVMEFDEARPNRIMASFGDVVAPVLGLDDMRKARFP